jgi:hypothetical protein
MSAIDDAGRRYRDDTAFHHMVDICRHIIVELELTPSEIREACMLAAYMVEMDRPLAQRFGVAMDHQRARTFDSYAYYFEQQERMQPRRERPRKAAEGVFVPVLQVPPTAGCTAQGGGDHDWKMRDYATFGAYSLVRPICSRCGESGEIGAMANEPATRLRPMPSADGCPSGKPHDWCPLTLNAGPYAYKCNHCGASA